MKGRVFEFPRGLWSCEIEDKGQYFYSFNPKRPTGFVNKSDAERCLNAKMELMRRKNLNIQFNGTTLSCDREVALEQNWELLVKITRPLAKGKNE